MDSESASTPGEETISQASFGYSAKELQVEIAAKIEWLQQHNGKTLHPDWITNAVLGDHPDIHGADSPFYSCCTRSEVRDETRRQLNRFKAKAEEEADKQLVLEGFERLQKYYLVARDGEQVAVRVDDLTDDEIEVKIRELRGMAAGCFQHVDELIRYRDRRKDKAAA